MCQIQCQDYEQKVNQWDEDAGNASYLINDIYNLLLENSVQPTRHNCHVNEFLQTKLNFRRKNLQCYQQN